MEFRAANVSAIQNGSAQKYLTEDITDSAAGQRQFIALVDNLGSAVDAYPEWHPILTLPNNKHSRPVYDLGDLSVYDGIDHTVRFVRGFVTCPYSMEVADRLVGNVNQIPYLHAYRLNEPLYADNTYPVVVEATNVSLEADGTIASRKALLWFLEKMVKDGGEAEVAETWWTIRSNLLGSPHGARSSLFVNQHVGANMRKILDAMNNSGVFGPIREDSLEMLSEKKRSTISNNLLRAALNACEGEENFTFELRGETCKASVRDTWDDGYELGIRVMIGDFDLHASGFYYRNSDRLQCSDPRGKRALAEKFL